MNEVPKPQRTPLTATQVSHQSGLQDWTFVLGGLQAEFAAPSFAAAGELVSSIVAAAEAANHHPDVDLRYPGRVLVRTLSHDLGGVSSRDLALARTISQLAANAGAHPAHDRAVQQLEIAIDTMDQGTIAPFWCAVLDYRYDADAQACTDPRGQGPSIWFQQLDEPRPVRNRIHFDITVPPEQAQLRIDAAVAAGGTVVSDEMARAFWILADAEGNEVCVCTWQDRDRH